MFLPILQGACRILVSQPGTYPTPPAVEVPCLNHWTGRKSPCWSHCSYPEVQPCTAAKVWFTLADANVFSFHFLWISFPSSSTLFILLIEVSSFLYILSMLSSRPPPHFGKKRFLFIPQETIILAEKLLASWAVQSEREAHPGSKACILAFPTSKNSFSLFSPLILPPVFTISGDNQRGLPGGSTLRCVTACPVPAFSLGTLHPPDQSCCPSLCFHCSLPFGWLWAIAVWITGRGSTHSSIAVHGNTHVGWHMFLLEKN